MLILLGRWIIIYSPFHIAPLQDRRVQGKPIGCFHQIGIVFHRMFDPIIGKGALWFHEFNIWAELISCLVRARR